MTRKRMTRKQYERHFAGTDKMTEEQLGEQVRDACKKLGWEFYWLRKTMFSSEGILDLVLVPVRNFEPQRRHILFRELKGHSLAGRLGTLSDAQKRTIELINAAGGDADMWTPADWFSRKILEELK